MSFNALVNVVAYGIPALLIILGFCAYLAGYSISALTSNDGLMNTGIAMITIGIIFYVLEFIAKIVITYYNFH
jgi:hypothetical protein